jgi:hypothetical protein
MEDSHPLHSPPYTTMSSTPIDSFIVSLSQAQQALLGKPDLAPAAREALEELQTQDTLISNEIMDQITTQQLPTLTTLPDNVVIVKDQDYEINAPELCVIMEPIRQPLPNILSPRTALSALSNPNISDMQVFEIAVTLANTAHKNHKDFTHQTELYEEAVTRLEKEACHRAPASDPPYGYIPNNNIAPYFTIPGRGGCLLMAPFLRKCPVDPTHVIRTLGTPDNDEEYLCPIYAAPCHSDSCSLSALPPWFVDLLHRPSPHAESLIEAATNSSDWGLGADLHHYSKKGKILAELYREKDRIIANIQAMHEDQEYVRHRLERAQAPLGSTTSAPSPTTTQAPPSGPTAMAMTAGMPLSRSPIASRSIAEVGSLSERRVMLLPAATLAMLEVRGECKYEGNWPKVSYRFCQELNLELRHDGGPCHCLSRPHPFL